MDIRRFFGNGAAPKAAASAKTTAKTPEATKGKSSTKAKKKEAKTPTKPFTVVVIDSDSEDGLIKVKQGTDSNVRSRDKSKTKTKAKDLLSVETSPSEKENKVTAEKEVEKRENKRGASKRDKSEHRKGEKCKRDKYEESLASMGVKQIGGEGKESSKESSDQADNTEENKKEKDGSKVKLAHTEKQKGQECEDSRVKQSTEKDTDESKSEKGQIRTSAKSKKQKAEENKATKSKRAKFGDRKEVTSVHAREAAEKVRKEKAEEKRIERLEEKTGRRKGGVVEDSSDDDAFSGSRKVRRSANSKKGAIIFDSDTDEEPVTPAQTRPRDRRKPANFVSDSDDEDRQGSIIDAFKKVTKKPSPQIKAKPELPAKRVCTMADFFGSSTPVHRVERKVLPVKRKVGGSPPVVTSPEDDMEIHDDDDFEQTLLLLDTSSQHQQPAKRPKLESRAAPSLASKLSSRLKEGTQVERSPERNKIHLISEIQSVEETPRRNKSPTSPDRSSIKKSPVLNSPVKNTPAKMSPVETSPSKMLPVKKSLAKLLAVEKSPAKMSPEKMSPVKKSPLRMSPVRKSPRRMSPVKKSPLRMSPVKKSPGRMSPVKTSPVVSLVTSSTPVRAAAASTATQRIPEQSPKGGRGGPGYRSYLNRAPPQALGSKHIPEGAPNCLEGLTFVISGVLESMERDDAKSLVERCGGKVTMSISKRTTYIVLGRDAGISKIAKAEEFGTKQLDEDGLLDLIRFAKGKKSKYEMKAEASKEKKLQNLTKSSQRSHTTTSQRPSPAQARPPVTSSPRVTSSEATLMWVDKYKPTSLKQVIGQQGPKSNANKLLNWLHNWHRWLAEGRKPAFNSRFNDDGAGFRAALLSGPPGVGKTTTATLVCQEAGFSYVELNASDTRSKKSLETEISELLGNHTLVDFFGDDSRVGSARSKATEGKTHCLIMDEVDGMAGNEDRGGMQELITLIKKSRIPIICMCNDRNHQKVRSLSNYCFDLRFPRPRIEQIKAAMMSMAYKEGLKIPPPALNEVIAAANQDVRQVIHNLSMWTVANKELTYDQIKEDASKATKDIKMGPFDVCRKVFVGGEETAKMSIHDKSDLFFHDYSFGPLFVHENYIHASPFAARGDKQKHLECLSRAIDSIADGDLVDRQIRSNQNWALLPLQAMYASVIPGEAMRGGFSRMVQFPSWLGKNSSRNKTDRILQELHSHMSLRLSGDRRALNMDYIPHLRHRFTRPLVDQGVEGVPEIISTLHEYDLLREDYTNVLEISQWSHLRDPLLGVDPKTKAAFTRAYNKNSHLTPYAAVVTAKKGRAVPDTELLGEEDTVAMEANEAQSDDDAEMFKASKVKRKKSAVNSDSAKGKGRGKNGPGKGGAGRSRGRGKAK